jgi:two-component system sensor histidine kinase FlrB
LSVPPAHYIPNLASWLLLTDLTETRRLQDQLSVMSGCMGRMVSLAHQIRTPLSAALLYASHLTEQVLPAEQQQRLPGGWYVCTSFEHQVRDMLIFARGELPLPDRLAQALFDALRSAAEPMSLDMQVRWQCGSHV